LETGSKIGDFAKRQLFLSSCSAHLSDNDQPRMNTYTDGELDTLSWLQTGIEVLHRIEDT